MIKMIPQQFIIAPQSKAEFSRTRVALVSTKYKTLYWKKLSEYDPKTDIKLYTVSREYKKWFVHYYGGTTPVDFIYYEKCEQAMAAAAALMHMSIASAKEVWKNLGLMPGDVKIPISATHARKIKESVRKDNRIPSDVHVIQKEGK